MKEALYIGGNGAVVAIDSQTTEVIWVCRLKSGWLKAGNPFVSLVERPTLLYAFSYGRLYVINKENGEIIRKGKEIKTLKYKAGVFAHNQSEGTSGEASVLCAEGDGDGGNSGGDGGDGDGGGD